MRLLSGSAQLSSGTRKSASLGDLSLILNNDEISLTSAILDKIQEDSEDCSQSLKKSSSENGLLNLYRKAFMSSPALARRSAGRLLGDQKGASPASTAAGTRASEGAGAGAGAGAAATECACSQEYMPPANLDALALTAAAAAAAAYPSGPLQRDKRLPSTSTEAVSSMKESPKPMDTPQLPEVLCKPDALKTTEVSVLHSRQNSRAAQCMSGSEGGARISYTKNAAQTLARSTEGASTSRSVIDDIGSRTVLCKASQSLGGGKEAPSGQAPSIPSQFKFVRSKTSALSSLYCPSDSDDEDTEEETRRITNHLRKPNKHHRSNSIISSPHDNIPDRSSASSRAVQSYDQGDLSDSIELDEASEWKKRSIYHLTNCQAAVELFLRLNHARQTLDFVKRQASAFAMLDKGQMSVWEALDALNDLREYETAMVGNTMLEPELPLRDHAIQTAELCRLAYPDTDWMHLVGLIHGLGKLLAHRNFGSQPQWAVCGESFPVGCRFDPSIQGAQFFTANPDRRRKQYNTPAGIYQPHCGLKNVFMSWSAAEYLYLILLLNGTRLPVEALFLVRHQKFTALTRPNGNAYSVLLNEEDQRMIPLLGSFQKLTVYKKVQIPEEVSLSGEKLRRYYDGLIEKYIGTEKLLW